MNSRLIVITLLIACIAEASGDELRPFTSDGCSAFPDGTIWQNELWLECCTEHDYAYWKGGSYKEREAADFALRECVAQVGEREIALLMLSGVRVGGTPLLPTTFRWGYGWTYPKWYGELTAGELQQVEATVSQARDREYRANGFTPTPQALYR
ncbi:hypothetical protein [Saccharospirillum impatiens]|uniref:hypothetical protein n=1 Tax=Saccharospirillum impatiens TaxID=169438 RepID=UPI000425934E|nr:hypothetical protein [Saccharospirillum impatiens]